MVSSSKSFGASVTPGGTRTESAAVGRSAIAVSMETALDDVGGRVGLPAGERDAFQLDVVGHTTIILVELGPAVEAE